MGPLGQVRRRDSHGGVFVENPSQQRRQAVVARSGIVGRCVAPIGLDDRPAAIGIGAAVERIKGSQNGSAARVDQIDSAEVPAGIADHHVTEVAIAGRDLETHA